MAMQVNTLYFSATGTTRKVVSRVAEELSENLEKGMVVKSFDFTLPEARKEPLSFAKEDIVVIGVPVIAGRVPNVLLKYLNSIKGNEALAIAIVVYGNRNYDDALIELRDILQLNSFKVIAGGAFVGEHSFSKILAKDRPDEKDMAIANNFADQIYSKITAQVDFQIVSVKGNFPYRNYYRPKNLQGEAVDIRKVTPLTNSDCTNCKLCVSVCPMGSIDKEDVSKLIGICIKCGACIKSCPTEAKYYDDEDYLRHKYELEIEFAARREPELFI
ncbi:ferredoxin [Desulfosporosinus sp. HMP52]|uniref:EFR1 family ferrodoxin n=1 Tax=Desulfosporosinus sp. HMP52 TaxID=1487923 RepID=UPI00051FDAC6|nr:EFR1 family ferrodoxin [Desulfosporosinus sp. HMP52]KGK85469.1 ferredoxin [Desulfosporosinus sp. HMP52]